ncbi:alanine racemase [Nocardioides aurantiacus]|uniref:D-serine deaminase-like pyridoxal phosphate-dependent protein n=1 Tax=Nocardioides aurantiacus TaxID=86796 RepID=A0A3N2CUQ4_9ACTN|nr:alanine racemase [Nocardioides aurantiacus]ROR91219.1 D-serine deaminase-like pyridoxal phosphate-dependent protein [Nocardioides aurantiacus]
MAPADATRAARARLGRRLDRALDGLDDPRSPLVVVDLDALEANADDLVHRADGTPLRVASKSVRVPALLTRVLARPGFAGVMAYTLREALWLVGEGVTDDVLLAYPTVDRGALARLVADERARASITLVVDDRAHLDLLRAAGAAADRPVRVALDVDAAYHPPRLDRVHPVHLGPRRSPLREVADVVALAHEAVGRGLTVVGAMTYEGQVAGLPDDVPGQRLRSAVVRRVKRVSLDQLASRRAALADALREAVGGPLELWNAGGSGDVAEAAADPVVTEVAAGSGLLVPGLFDHYRSFEPRPAAFFAVPVVRRPAPGTVTVAGGGFVASGATGRDRAPLPWAPPGLALSAAEGAGEVQTPLTGPAADALRIGDRVWFRHAKSGELMEHTDVVHLVRGEVVEESAPSYRGLGLAW